MEESKIREIIEQNIDVSKKLLNNTESIVRAVNLILNSLNDGGKIIFFGNGGSAADAQHISAELSGKFYNSLRPGLPSIALTTNSSAITAIGNDFGYEHIFSRQLEGLTKSSDVVIGISTSGNSLNVLNGLKKAKEIGCTTISFTGKSEGEVTNFSDCIIQVPSQDTPRIQEKHILIGHIICELVEKEMFE